MLRFFIKKKARDFLKSPVLAISTLRCRDVGRIGLYVRNIFFFLYLVYFYAFEVVVASDLVCFFFTNVRLSLRSIER